MSRTTYSPRCACSTSSCVDLFLRRAAAADELADVEARGIAAREIEHFGGHEPVVHDDIRFLQRAQALQAS